MDSRRGGSLWGNGDGYQRIDTGTELQGGKSYQQSVDSISNNIRQMNLNVSKIDNNVNLLGKPRDSQDNRNEILSLIKNTGSIASSAASQLKDLSTTSSSSSSTDPDRNKTRLRLRDDLERSLTRFRQSSTAAKDKLTSTPLPSSSSSSASSLPQKNVKSNNPNPNSNNPTYQNFNLGAAQPYDFATEEEDMERKRTERVQRQGLILLDDEMNLQDAIIAERDQGIKLIEKEMLEVRDIFQDLGNIVEEQQVLFSHLDQHITSSVSAVERGVEEQRQAASYQKSGRNCTCILLVGAIIVVIVVVALLVIGISVFRKQLPF